MSAVCGAVLARVRTPRHGLPKAPTALCLVVCEEPGGARAVLDDLGGSLARELGWAPRAELRAVGEPGAFVREPRPEHLRLAAAFSFVPAHGVDARRAWKSWLSGEPGLTQAVGLRFKSRLDRPLRFVRERADADEFLLRHELPCVPLDAEESVAFRQRWRERHLARDALAARSPRRPRGKQSTSWTYDWDALARAEDVTAEEAVARLGRARDLALFFEAADLPVYRLPRAYLGALSSVADCDLYCTTYPDAGPTVAWDHEGFGPRWSQPRRA